MARILITGGAGYIGSHCAKALAAAGHESVVFDNLSSGHRDFVRWGPLAVGDVRDRSALNTVLRGGAIEAVLHFAALASVGQSMTDPAAYYDINVHGTRTLLDSMREAGVENIVFSSSCAVYGAPAAVPIDEATPLAPVNPYGFTKLVCERMMEEFASAYGLRSVRLRYFNAAGADSEGEIGEDHTPETHLIPLALDVALGRRDALQIFGSDHDTPDGTAIRDYIHVSDLAAAHVAATGHLLKGGKSLALNLGTGKGFSVAEIAAKVAQITSREIPVVVGEKRPGDPTHLVADTRGAARVLGWTATRSSLDGIVQSAWDWHQRRKTK